MEDLLSKLFIAETSQEVLVIAEKIASNVNASELLQVLAKYEVSLAGNGLEREAGLLGMAGLALKPFTLPFLIGHIPAILDQFADKGSPVREAAQLALDRIIQNTPPQAFKKVLLGLMQGAHARKWQSKVGAIKAVEVICDIAPGNRLFTNFQDFISFNLPEIISVVEEVMHDTKTQVADAAKTAMKKFCSLAGNEDIEPHIEILVECMAHPESVPDTIKKISATTFVQDMTGPALAVLIPLLCRAVNERTTAILRPTALIIDNLCKLVKNPDDAGQFLPLLLPGLEKIIEMAAIPEVRELATTAKNSLQNVGGFTSHGHNDQESKLLELESEFTKHLSDILSKDTFISSSMQVSVDFVAIIFSGLVIEELFDDVSKWEIVISSYLSPFLLPNVPLAQFYLSLLEKHRMEFEAKIAANNQIDTDEGEELSNCEFSLAYGTRLLLNRTRLRLLRGQRYGLCGHNGAGKTTLMRSIAEDKVEGFPSPDVLKTVFVQHILQGEEGNLSVINFILNGIVTFVNALDPRLAHLGRDVVEEGLAKVGFDSERREQAVGTLSGGWKMKLELGRAVLMKADILLLDEPTNHLDKENVKWLEDYLNSQTQITSLIVSHDSGFLDNVCSYIINYESKKLVFYKGNLSKFVEKKPEAKSYYTLAETRVKFTFPPPSILVGIRSNTKAILKLTNGTFTYPGASKPSIYNASVQLSLSSRVAVLGPNGAGKSTLIKLLTGETIPQQGILWKHPNLRVGYVAQHAFHHLNQHLEKTPNQYLQWRYQGGQDKELLEKVTRKMNDEDISQMKTYITGRNGEKRQIEVLVGRSKLKKSFQYEIKWVGKEHRHNSTMPREELINLGFSKIVQAFDDWEASREGQSYRELIPSVIRKHFEDVGLEGEIADHSLISGLSGGQKVKVVLAAAMWNNPHLLVLDEPTNYLDREALGGLAVAIQNWAGAVIMISHNAEFFEALCPEKWHVKDGNLTIEGKTGVQEEDEADHQVSAEKIAARATKSKIKKKKLTRNELKAQEVRRRARHLKWLVEGGQKEPDTESD